MLDHLPADRLGSPALATATCNRSSSSRCHRATAGRRPWHGPHPGAREDEQQREAGARSSSRVTGSASESCIANCGAGSRDRGRAPSSRRPVARGPRSLRPGAPSRSLRAGAEPDRKRGSVRGMRPDRDDECRAASAPSDERRARSWSRPDPSPADRPASSRVATRRPPAIRPARPLRASVFQLAGAEWSCPKQWHSGVFPRARLAAIAAENSTRRPSAPAAPAARVAGKRSAPGDRELDEREHERDVGDETARVHRKRGRLVRVPARSAALRCLRPRRPR